MVPVEAVGVRDRVVRWAMGTAIRLSLLVSPRPAALLVRTVFSLGGAQTAKGLARHAPTGVAALRDERYGTDEDMLLDVYSPQSASRPLPVVVWVHGGGFVGGSKEELGDYFALLASQGYVVVGPRYSLAPEHHYPTPLRQVMQVMVHLQANAARLGLDPDRIVLAGDSAGAQIAAQVAALVTTPGYAERVGVPSTIRPEQLRAVVLACGPYDLALASDAGTPTGRRLLRIMVWAYTGKRRYQDDPAFGIWSVTEHVSGAFPPALVTVGNADPLRPHSELLVERLRAQGLEPQTVFWPADHAPALNHEYQFDLDTSEGQLFLERLVAFLRQRTEGSPA
jgi:acetyl esterase/lipase